MKKQNVALILLLIFTCPALASDCPIGGIRLLAGYKCKSWSGTDTSNGAIYKDGGLYIEYEYGLQEGQAARPDRRNDFIWYKEQIVNHRLVRIALAKPGVGTSWEAEAKRSRSLSNILIITIPLGDWEAHAINFYAEVQSQEEMADMLLMVLTYDPHK